MNSQADCFKLNLKFWKFLAIWPGDDYGVFYRIYKKTFILLFVLTYSSLMTVNFYYLPKKLDVFIEQMLFYFTVVSVTSKAMTFLFMREKIRILFEMLEYDVFKPDTDEALIILDKAKLFIKRYWKVVAVISYVSNLSHVSAPFIAHLLLPIDLELPICSYLFIPDGVKKILIYPLFFYQSFGMHVQMLFNVNIDTFFIGLMILMIAQLDILDFKLRHVADYKPLLENESENEKEQTLLLRLNKCIIHFHEISKFCSLTEEVFSVTLFIQFGMASCILCTCLFRFTLPAETSYYVFLATYMTVMTSQIAVPCWFGSQILDKSNLLSLAVYNCDWTPRRRQFKSNLRLFVERTNKPLSIIGGKMFPLSLNTFSSIANSAYSFFTLLRHMQTRDS